MFKNIFKLVQERVKLVVVVVAFGMGIDPPKVERVIQFDVPRKMEHYHST